MTYGELITNEQFIALCETWKETSCCPAPLVDWFLDRGMELQAEAARYAVNKKSYNGQHLRPVLTWGNNFLFNRIFGGDVFHYYNCVPVRYSILADTFHECIAQYLYQFEPWRAEKYPPKECIV